MNRVIRRCVPLMVASLAFVWLGGCGPTTGAFCEDQRQCMGGNDKDEEACVALADYSEELADIQGCSDEYDDYFDCFFDYATCQTAQSGYNCQSLADCEGAGSGATCQNGQCVVKRLALESSETCRPEREAYDSCSYVDIGFF